MEPVGLTIGVASLTGQLARAAMDCYKIFEDMSDVGATYDSILHKLRTEGLRLKGWEEAWGLGNDVDGSQGRLDPGDYRYRYATATLARIVAVFASVDRLHAKYGIVVKQANTKGSEPRRYSWLSLSLPFRSRSKSPLRNSNSNTQLVIPTIHENDLHLLENPRVLGNQQLLPGLPEEIISMTRAMDRVHQSLPIYHKLRWVVSDKAKLDDLLRTLTSLNDGLFQVIPTPGRSVLQAKSQVSAVKPSFEIPFLPNINTRKSSEFVGREYLLENLKQNVEEGKHTLNYIVVYGTGGMGKTQLALEYIHRYYNDHSSVFWINAASDQTIILGFTQIIQRLIEHHARISDDYSHIGRLLGMAGKLDSNGSFAVAQPSEAQHVVHAVKGWLAPPENNNWLLVFDNLDDPDSVDIGEYIPACNHGTVIITSRRRDLQQGRRGFEVQQMQPMEAIQLLLKASGIPKLEDLGPSERPTASTIVQELGYLPLALDQAGAYIHMSQYSLGRYLKEYQTNASYLLSKWWKGGKQDRSVFATWEISFNTIQDKNPEAAKLLLICGFLNNEDIWEELLKRGMTLETHALEESIRTLLSYSLAKRSGSDDSFSIHPLVHSWAKLRLESEPQKETEIAMEVFDILGTGVHIPDEGKMCTDDWIYEQRVIPHIDAVTKHMRKYMDIQARSSSLGDVYRRHGRHNKALEWYRRVLEGSEKALGVDHPSTLTIVHKMAVVFDRQGLYERALEWYGRALAGREKILGVDHLDTLASVHSIALVFDNQGRYSKALEWYRQALGGREKALGMDHPSSLTTVHNIAAVYNNQGMYTKALEWYWRALAGEEKALGVDHPSTLTTVHSMALVFDNQGEYAKALQWYERALAGREKALGVDHPSTLTTVHNMASVFSNQGQYDKALEWYGRVLAREEQALGVDHPSTLTTVHNMAVIFDSQRQYDKAREWYGRALSGREKALGIQHPLTRITTRCLIDLQAQTGHPEKVQSLRTRLHVPNVPGNKADTSKVDNSRE